MNQGKLLIIWNKTTGEFQVQQENVTDAEIMAVLKAAHDMACNQTLQNAAKSGVVILPPGSKLT